MLLKGPKVPARERLQQTALPGPVRPGPELVRRALRRVLKRVPEPAKPEPVLMRQVPERGPEQGPEPVPERVVAPRLGPLAGRALQSSQRTSCQVLERCQR